MRVKDLIMRLQACDPNAMVVVDGYEGGCTELRDIHDSVEIALDVNSEHYYGPHEFVYGADCNNDPDVKHVYAVYLPR